MGVLMADGNGEVLAFPTDHAPAMSSLGWVRIQVPTQGDAGNSATHLDGAKALPPQALTDMKKPAPSASRGHWARYAETVGVTPGTLTKAQLQAAVSEAHDG